MFYFVNDIMLSILKDIKISKTSSIPWNSLSSLEGEMSWVHLIEKKYLVEYGRVVLNIKYFSYVFYFQEYAKYFNC